MNEPWKDAPRDIRVNTVMEKQKDFKVVAVSSPVQYTSKTDEKYDELVAKHIQNINSQEAILARDKSSLALEMGKLRQSNSPVVYDGERVRSAYTNLHTLDGRRAQETLGLFNEFQKTGNYMAFDIETFGDTNVESNKPFGVSEIAINEYNKDGKLVKKHINAVLQQTDDVIETLQASLNKIKADKYGFNGMDGWEKRSLVDLMRYSSVVKEGDANGFSYKPKSQTIQHHSVIGSVFDNKDQIDNQKVIRHMDEYIEYMQSGLDNMRDNNANPKTTMEKVAKLIQKNPNKFFVSYNGNQFDVPVLQGFGEKVQAPLPSGMKHLDYLNVIKTVYMDSDDLKREVMPEYTRGVFGKDKLAAFREILPAEDSSQKDAHNSQVDTNDTAKVVAATRSHVAEKIAKSTTPLQDGFNYHPTEMTWNDTPAYHGQQLFANGGVQAFREGDESFSTSFDKEKNKWVQESSGFNKTVIQSKSFYEFAGHEDMGDDRHAFRFFNPDTQQTSYVVRQGQHALAELEDFMQARFYNVDNVGVSMKREMLHTAETDRARRRYDRYFSMDGGGKGIAVIDGQAVEKGTAGFSGLKRAVANAEVMEAYKDSNGQIYRDAVEQYKAEGLSHNQAKKKARKVTKEQLHEKLNFDSLWDNDSKQYVFNKKEKDQFFKMHQRLIDEKPFLQQAIKGIDTAYMDRIQQIAQETNPVIRRDRLLKVNQERDRAVMNYQQTIASEIGAPQKSTTLKGLDSKRISFFDPESNDNRSLNFETVETARNSIYGYARRGVGKDDPNKQQIIKERMFHLIDNLHSQNKIDKEQHSNYIKALHETSSSYNASKEIAINMHLNSNGKFDTERMDSDITQNKDIKKKLSNERNAAIIERAIRDTENAKMIIDMDSTKGTKLRLSKEMQATIKVLDESRFSGLQANNQQALEELVTSIRKSAPDKHIAMVMDNASSSANMKLYVYDGKNSIQVNNQLNRGTLPTQALEINMPLINQSGTHKVGGMTLNSHSVAVLDGKKVEKISSAQQIARGYANDMGYIMKSFNEGNIEEANRLSKRTLRKEIENMSGIQRNIEGVNDTYAYANNQSDALKQSHVKVANAMIEDLYYNGYENIKLTEKDFYNPEDVFRTDEAGNKVLRRGVSMDDVSLDSSHKILMNMPEWAQKQLKVNVFTSSVKADHVSKGVVSLEDVRQLIPYGSYYNHGRDNAVQYMNAYLLNDGTKEKIEGIKGLSRDSLLQTSRQMEYENDRARLGLAKNDVSINMKTAYMTQDQLRYRTQELYNDPEQRKMLGEIGLLTEEGKLNHLKLPRLYEQQGIIAKDVAEALNVDNEKRFEKGKQFKVTAGLDLGSKINPGDVLGIRTFDNGHKETIKYEGTKQATLIQNGQDMLVRWESDPFKIMLDGEKMTDSPVDRRFIQALTGQDDVVAIINPDVAKHKDFGMLMSGEARLMAQEIRGLNETDRASAINIIEKGDIGLKWNADMQGFEDKSFGGNIKSDAFDQVFAKLNKEGINISPVTSTGVRVGILDAHLSKVANYSKVTDGTGKRVISMDADGKPIHGGRDGVQWGHREMGVLKGQGLNETYNYVFKEMTANSNRLGEVQGVIESLEGMASTSDEHAKIEALSTSDFNRLPEKYRTENTYKGTIFDKKTLVEKFGERAAITDRGFWLDLPGVKQSDGHLKQVTVNMDGKTNKAIDKIFIPFTASEGANGDIHLRDLQKKIANVYKRAAEVSSATSIDDARTAQEKLQTAVTNYTKQSFKELSASKGMMIEDVFKTNMKTSASGLFKLMDYDTSMKAIDQWGEGQYSVISKDMAEKMGVYEQLKNGDELFTANVRYPTFHDGAMQFNKLKMADWVKEGEIHTSSFSSMLQNADSDGDYSHITVIQDKDIQKEWKKAHETTEARFQKRYDDHVEKENPSGKEYKEKVVPTLQNTNDGPNIGNKIGNSVEETAAKIGKMTIGRASNLNLYLRQIADDQFASDKNANSSLKRLGEGLEQKLIDAKHGAEPVGLKMIDAIYKGDWDKAKELDNQYFKKNPDDAVGMFQKDYNMAEVARDLPPALTGTSKGLKTRGLKFGTSTGIQYGSQSSHGVVQMLDLIYGRGDKSEFGGDNKALGMFHKFLRSEGVALDIDAVNEQAPYESSARGNMGKRNPMGIPSLSTIRNKTGDGVRSGISGTKNKIADAWKSVQGSSMKQRLLVGGGLAVAGITGYNILNTEKPEMHYKDEEPVQEEQVQAPRPQITTPQSVYQASPQNASISIRASGGAMQQEQISHAVSQGMTDSNMNAGPTSITMNHQDNTQQLNRNWYRDKVRENI